MNYALLYPLTGILIAGAAALRVRHFGIKNKALIAYLSVAVFAVLGFANVAGAAVSSATALYILIATGGALLLLFAGLKMDVAKPWRLAPWAAYVPLTAVLGTAILLLRSWPVFSIMRDAAPLSVWSFGLAACSSLLLLLVGGRVLFAYYVAPLIAVVGRQRHWRSSRYFDLLQSAHKSADLALLDVREDALSYYIEAEAHQKAAVTALELGHLDIALEQFAEQGDRKGQADVLAQQERWVEAAELYNKGGAPLKAAQALRQAKEFSQAAALYLESNQQQDYIAVCEEGNLFESLGGYYRDRRSYSDAALAFARGGHLDQAAQCYHSAQAYLESAKIYIKLADYAKAQEEYEAADALPSFIKLLRADNQVAVLEEMKRQLVVDCTNLRNLQVNKDAVGMAKAFPQLLARLDILALNNPIDVLLVRQIAWGAITFFESQKNKTDLERAYQAALTLRSLVERGLILVPMETFALSVRLLLFSAIHAKYQTLRQHLSVFLPKLENSAPQLKQLSEQERKFLRAMVQNTVQVLTAHSQTRLASDVRRCLKVLQ